MGNKQGKQTNRMVDQENSRIQGESNQFNQTYQPERTAEKGWADKARSDIYGGYKNLTDPNFMNSMGFGGGGGGGVTYQAPKLQAYNLQLDPRYKALEEGDYSKLKGGVHEALSGYRDFASTGGYGEDLANARRGFNDFANTGGYSEGDISNIRGRATSAIPSFYDSLRNRMAQKQNAAGMNMGGMYSAASDRMARQGAQGAGQAALDAELGISDRVRSGRQFGIGGQMNIANAVQQGRQFGLGGMERIGGLGLSGMENIAGTSQQIANQNEMERASIANQNAQAQAEAANASASSAASAARGNADDRYRAYMGGLGGMTDIYATSPAELSRYDEMAMGNRQLRGGQTQANLGLRASYNPQRDWWDRATQGIGAGAGLAGAFMGAGA